MKNPALQKNLVLNRRLFAVLCPASHNYFLVDESEAFSPALRSKFTGEVLALDGRFVQWLPDTQLKSLSVATVRKIGRSLVKIGGLARAGRRSDFPSYADFTEMVLETKDRIPKHPDLPPGVSESALREVVADARKGVATAFESGYYEGHRIAFDVVGSNVICFEVGRSPGLLLAVPVEQTKAPANTEEMSGLEIAKDIALGVTFILELLDFIGQFIGLPPNTAKVADKIGKWLEDVRVLKIIRKFIEELRKGIAKDKLYDLLRRLVTDLWDVGGFTEILKEMFSISGWGLAWLLLTLLSALVPGAAALKVIQFLARVAGLAAKVVAAFA